MKGGIATSSNFLSGEPAFIMPFNKYSFFLKSIIIKALKILRLMQSAQGLIPRTPKMLSGQPNAVMEKR